MSAAQVLFGTLLALAGACLGSFIATAALRHARAEPFLLGRSHCDSCGYSLGFLATLPLVSYVGLRGACSNCGARIDATHPFGELCGAVALAAPLAVIPLDRALLVSALALVLLAAAIIDLKTLRLPDGLTLATAMLGGVLAALRSLDTLLIGLVAAALTFAVLEVVRSAYVARRRVPGLGQGDVKLAAALALWLGMATPWALAAAALIGVVWAMMARNRGERFAFGPALAAGALAIGIGAEALRWPA
jgi:leader peptidase (prepilin peptidase)/N-methyltransferase